MNRKSELSIRCGIADGRIAGVKLHGRAVQTVDKLAYGKTPQEAIQLFSLMFALCGHAHQRAAVNAFEQALLAPAPPAVGQFRAIAGSVEIIKEHALNLLLNLSSGEITPELPQAMLAAAQAFGKALDSSALYQFPYGTLAPDASAYEQALCALSSGLHAMLGDFLGWTHPSLTGVGEWQRDQACVAARYMQHYAQTEWAGFGQADTQHLPSTATEELEAVLSGSNAEAFLAAPHWRGKPCETNAYTRLAVHPLIREAVTTHGNGLYARSLARLLEIRLLFDSLPRQLPTCSKLSACAVPAANGTALVQVEASRGRLLHRVEVRDGLIAAYRIIAPTQWNFHPLGLLSSALTGQDARDEEHLQRRIEAWVATLDPCVAFNVLLEHGVQ
ncbi:hypothetical protein F6R98_20955 [Candidatus Methylospira mobilis]|uniref:Ni,Fe-hydrogenase I large subunit n=1 Tax=Candidatus Methylospira mobilis TaxID=1808979 RepID=A0A5Q0BRH1_9GAMM|nr:nickel-dependent hydrogenase large subunit [Candidatus Methylospira mobilis]QFY44794.1 hypothetical protein F6R98_20955 [Candidatus Methylospira mobilis]